MGCGGGVTWSRWRGTRVLEGCGDGATGRVFSSKCCLGLAMISIHNVDTNLSQILKSKNHRLF